MTDLFGNEITEKEKDWNGNKISSFVQNGCSNHSDLERVQDDYYATDPAAVEKLLEVETFHNDVWENACGGGIFP